MSVEGGRRSAAGILKLYRAYWEFAAGRRRWVVAASALLAGSQLTKLAVPWLAAQAINAVQLQGAEGLRPAAGFVALILAAAAVSWALHGPGRIVERSLAVRVRQNLADRLYSRLADLPLTWHDVHHSGDTVQRVRQTSDALFDFAQSQFLYLQNFVNLCGPLGAIAWFSPTLGAVALGGYAIVALVVIRFDRALMRLAQTQNQAERRYIATLGDALGNISTVLSLRMQAVTRRLVEQRLGAVFEPLRRSIVLTEWKWCGVDLLTITLTWGLVALHVWLSARGGGVLVGDAFMVYQYAQQAAGVIGGIAANYQQFVRMQVDFGSADPIWAAQPRAPVPAIPPDWGEIRLEGVALRYTRRAGDPPALTDATLTLRRGERVALAGPSGAGKSTLLRVLAGLYDAEEGTFEIDGVAAPHVRHLAAIATMIPQDPQIFEGSLLDNLDLGAGYPAAALARAMEIADLQGVVAALPDGLESAMVERGANLSGGQRQRLALARGVLAAAQSSLVLLDEPTSSLDMAAERKVLEALLQAFPDACVLASVHRLALLALFDRVILMERGRVVGDGSLTDLLAKDARFRELWTEASQARDGNRMARGRPIDGTDA